ncbi:MAG: Deoxyguanosinetriphosphate triphosphohydrolase-like protein, partial [Chlamydiae bacterium]|nr:Deoxyguanosinetriphosphate triphosphohydrolase-like protein [Chlamydiota bacterium]
MSSHSYPHKICDPIHGFIRYDEVEGRLIDSRPFQRLRYIHQMGVAYLLYPGATHSRFEHSLGVMELASHIFDTLLAPRNLIFGESIPKSDQERGYWRRILRLAALCHDIGHLPFSHTAEKALLPDGGHEKMTLQLVQSDELRTIWNSISEEAESDICKVLVGEGEFWEQILYKIIAEDNFGADRIDYLLRDAYYTGVGYGHFDFHQLVDTLRILPQGIGVSISGVQSVESLWIARYMMFARVYHHPKLRVYTHHMNRFLSDHFPTSWDLESYLQQTDYTVLTLMAEAAKKGDFDARCLLKMEEPFQEVVLEDESKED